MRHIKFPSIEQYRNAVGDVKRLAGDDALPILNFKGTVKAHGTNASVSRTFYPDGGMDDVYFGSRTQIVTVERDNAGFALFAHARKEVFAQLIYLAIKGHEAQLLERFANGFIVSLFGEWAGAGIQGGVALSQIDKLFILFGVKISSVDDAKNEYGKDLIEPVWLPIDGLSSHDSRIYNINDFPTYDMQIDFANPGEIINIMVAITEAIEAECPIGKFFGVHGVGEGVVWSAVYKGRTLRFKVKGEKHSSSKVKKLATVDPEKIESMRNFVDYALSESRLKQGLKEIYGDGPIDRAKTGEFIRWVISDVFKEETDTIVANGIDPKNAGKYMSDAARRWLFNQENLSVAAV